MNARSQPTLWLSVAALVAGCATTDIPSTATHSRRQTPSTRAIDRAFAAVESDALRCVTPGVHGVRVRGAFEGDDGHYAVENVVGDNGAAIPYAVEQCVRSVAARAHVRPFARESFSAERSFAPATTTASSGTSSGPSSGSTYSSSSGTTTTPRVTGGITFGPTPEDLVRREGDALQRCFEQGSEQDERLAGAIELRFLLNAQGTLVRSSTRVVRETGRTGLMQLVAQCAESHLRLVHFGTQGDGGGEHVVPITFGEPTERFSTSNGLREMPVEK